MYYRVMISRPGKVGEGRGRFLGIEGLLKLPHSFRDAHDTLPTPLQSPLF